MQRSTCSMTMAPEGAVCCVLCSASPVPGVVRESFVVKFYESVLFCARELTCKILLFTVFRHKGR